MTRREAVDRLLTAFPREDVWPPMRGESYGPAHVDADPDYPVSDVLYAVTCTRDVEQAFRRGSYELLVLHHPMRPVAPIPHVVLHTPLDCGVGGLNDWWRDALGLQNAKHITDNLGWYGTIPTTATPRFLKRLRDLLGVRRFDGQVYSTVPVIGSVAVCAGLGGWIAGQAADTGATAFITGELVQPADQIGCPVVIEMGHTRSERVGIHAIRRVLGPDIQVDFAPDWADRFGTEVYKK